MYLHLEADHTDGILAQILHPDDFFVVSDQKWETQSGSLPALPAGS